MDFKTMHNQRKFVLIAAAVGLISTFLPWATVSAGRFGSISTNAFGGWGILVFLGYAGAIAFAFLRDQKQQMDANFWILTLFCGALALLITLIAILQVSSAGGTRFGGVGVSIGFGAFISLVAAGGVVFAAWKFKKPEHTIQDGFDALFKGGSQGAPATAQSSASNRMQELDKLVQMRNEGKISEEEYQDLKSKIL